jgi:alkyl hydroperoxide reductase subunit D
MDHIERLLTQLSPEAGDLLINARRVLAGESLSPEQTWGCALASAFYIRHPALTAALLADAKAAGLSADFIKDARGAAAIMGMNTVYFRFRHLMKTEAYHKMPFNLSMKRMQQVATNKENFELFSIGPAALAGCELCLQAHEAAVKKGGMDEVNVHDVVRIASVLQGIAVALDMPAELV